MTFGRVVELEAHPVVSREAGSAQV
jgi:hypothetical protein